MKRLKYFIGIYLTFSLVNALAQNKPTWKNADYFKKIFQQEKVKGGFVTWDEKNNSGNYCDSTYCSTQFSPASTFKIPNTLIALEANILPNENYQFIWDGKQRNNPNWNKNQNLKEAFKNSCVWCYQEIARKTEAVNYKKHLKIMNYGNQCIDGPIDLFWLNGKLRISSFEQIQFLTQLKNNSFGYRSSVIEKTIGIMQRDSSAEYTVYGKTGWGMENNKDYGWFVGFIQYPENTIYFALLIEKNNSEEIPFAETRFKIFNTIMKELKYIN